MIYFGSWDKIELMRSVLAGIDLKFRSTVRVCTSTGLLLTWMPLAMAETGYHLSQSSMGHGRVLDLYVSQNRVKWVCKDSKLSLYSQAPDWTLYVCNDDKKLVFPCKVKEYQGHLNYIATLSAGEVIQEIPLRLVSRGSYLNLPAMVYNLDKARMDAKAKKQYFRTVQLIEISPESVSPAAARIVRKIYGTPEAPGLPVYFGFMRRGDGVNAKKRKKKNPGSKNTSVKTTRKLTDFLKTYSIKKEKMPEFARGLPRGYKIVKQEQDLTRNPNAERGMELMLH